MKAYRIITLGCKVNQCESAAMACSLEASGFREAAKGQAPDLVVINSCAVTGKAAMQSRQAIRRAIRAYPHARIVATGCYAQVGARDIAAIEGVDRIVAHQHKLAVDHWVAQEESESNEAVGLPVPARRTDPRPDFAALCSAADQHRTRAFLKIQDGCNTRCTYCIVPLARGASRSMPAGDVARHVGLLADRGFREVVFTGIHLGAWGQDLLPAANLADLLADLAGKALVDRLRISSIEPMEINSRMIALMADGNRGICPHVHIPLQSGDDTILKRMGRGYTREQFAGVVNEIHRSIPQAAIGIDVLVGFPGEDDHAFDNTYQLIAHLPATYLHVFPYSRRPGTPAAQFKDQVPQSIAKQRCQTLRRLGEEKRRDFYTRQIGTRARVLVEATKDKFTGLPRGTTDNYLPVSVLAEGLEENRFVEVEISGFDKDRGLVGKPI